MWFLWLLSWVSNITLVCGSTLAIACGLYYLAELVEEYTVATKKVVHGMVTISTVFYIGMILFEGTIPWNLILAGLASNVTYYFLLQTFPHIQLTSLTFISACVLLILNHYLAFSHFANVWYPFSEVLAFFTIFLWIIPFTFFISLSANENVLPTTTDPGIPENDNDIVSNYFKRKSRKYGLLAFMKFAEESLLPQRIKKGF